MGNESLSMEAASPDAYAGAAGSTAFDLSPFCGAAEPSLFDLQRFSLELRRRTGYIPAEELADTFERELEHCSVVSFDIFDTLLIRYVEHPEDLFLHLDDHPAFQALKLAAPVSRLRKAAEAHARHAARELTKSSEVNLEEIYGAFCDLNELSRDLAPSLVEAEEQIERRLCVANKSIVDLYKRACAAAKRVVYVSDMYHRASFLTSLLQENGFAVAPGRVFVSSEYRGNKYEGTLFRKVIEQLAVRPEEILHVGDHPLSDYQAAKRLGLRALLHPCRAASEHPSPAANPATAALQSYRRGMSRAADCNFAEKSFYWRIGYRTYGPLLAGFCQWLGTKLREDGVKQAWFVLRDGEILAKIFKVLFSDDEGRPKVSTLLLSRRALLLPILIAAPDYAFPMLLNSTAAMSIRGLCERLGLDAEPLAAEIARSGFRSLDTVVDYPQRLNLFATNRTLQEALGKRCLRERSALLEFLQQEGVLNAQNIALVDVGWCGTIQTALQVVLAEAAPKAQVTGYYLGTTKIASALRQRSYAASCGEPKQLIDLIYPLSCLLECFTTTASGSLSHFKMQGGRSVPVFLPRETGDEQCRFLEEMHQGAMAFAQDFRERASNFHFDCLTSEIALESYVQLLACPTPEEALKLGALQHGEDMGSKRASYLARWPASATTASGIWDSYERSLWKMGMIRQINNQSAALRTLLWLQQAEP